MPYNHVASIYLEWKSTGIILWGDGAMNRLTNPTIMGGSASAFKEPWTDDDYIVSGTGANNASIQGTLTHLNGDVEEVMVADIVVDERDSQGRQWVSIRHLNKEGVVVKTTQELRVTDREISALAFAYSPSSTVVTVDYTNTSIPTVSTTGGA